MMDHEFSHSIIVAARGWIGTPYVHQCSTRGQGTDCLGLIRGVWREVIGSEPEKAPDYSRDWGEVSDKETMLEAAEKWFVKTQVSKLSAGDLLLFRWRNTTVVKHAGIHTGCGRFIHAYEKAGVVETCLGTQWNKRIAAVYKFPNPKSDR